MIVYNVSAPFHAIRELGRRVLDEEDLAMRRAADGNRVAYDVQIIP
jgi:hypothetical protein